MNLLTAWQQTEGADCVTPGGGTDADTAVTALYAEHALGLTRLAHVMLGDRPAAEDVVHDAFAGLYRNWQRLHDQARAQAYLRTSVLNGCRTVLRRAGRPLLFDVVEHEPGAEASVLASADRAAVLAALRGLPDRQREALVLRFYLDLPDAEIAAAMSVGESTVRSTIHRGLAAVARILAKELS
ncbi:MAG TPA: sigma-70 family RNA polymerase sigma factor [Streptosporangiaceae bacterium]|nr:sigma-70 family RNA polymerase sigma factor [Streptosporangiaceae bacterium]